MTRSAIVLSGHGRCWVGAVLGEESWESCGNNEGEGQSFQPVDESVPPQLMPSSRDTWRWRCLTTGTSNPCSLRSETSSWKPMASANWSTTRTPDIFRNGVRQGHSLPQKHCHSWVRNWDVFDHVKAKERVVAMEKVMAVEVKLVRYMMIRPIQLFHMRKSVSLKMTNIWMMHSDHQDSTPLL